MLRTNLDRYKADLAQLLLAAKDMFADMLLRDLERTGELTEDEQKARKRLKDCFESRYQSWYTEAGALVRQLIPDRLAEFEHLYKGDGKRREIVQTTYTIQDWLNGVRAGTNRYTGESGFDDLAATTMRFQTQRAIVAAVERRFESSLFDIRQLVQADLFDSELDAARELAKNGFLRAAGAIAGVVLEKHVGQVTANHKVTMRKPRPTINDYNQALKDASVLDVPAWRNIQRLGDLRNLCDHDSHREPTKDDITELTGGVEKLTKTLF